MSESTELIRKPVFIRADIVQEIKKRYEVLNGTQHGAFQDTLARGAELALGELRAKTGVPVSEQMTPDSQVSVKSGTLSEFEGLTAEEAEDLRLFLDMLRNGDERDRQMARFGVESWKARKAPQENVRAVSQQPAPKKKTKSKGSDPRQ